MPLDVTTQEVTTCGMSLFLYVIFLLPSLDIWENDIVSQTSTVTLDGLIEFHDEITSNRGSILFATAIILLVLPLPIIHALHLKRILEVLFSFIFLEYFAWFYVIMCVMADIFMLLVAVCNILTAYYSWELIDVNTTSSIEHTGYYIQLSWARSSSIMGNMITWLVGLLSIIPLIVFVIILREKGRSRINPNSTEHEKSVSFARKEFITQSILCTCINHGFCLVFLVIIIFLIIFASLGDLFAWQQSGFWSLSGGSQWLASVNMIFCACFGLWLLILARRMDSNGNAIKSANQQAATVKDLEME